MNARSVTAGTFTEREHNAAPAHFNVGNHVMANAGYRRLARPAHADRRDQGVTTGARLPVILTARKMFRTSLNSRCYPDCVNFPLNSPHPIDQAARAALVCSGYEQRGS